MDDSFLVFGLPLHPLLVHAVVVLAPLTAGALVLGQFAARARRRLGLVTVAGAAVVLALTPPTVAAGTALAVRVGPVPGLSEHAAHGGMLLPWAVALFGVALAQWLWFRRADAHPSGSPRGRAVRGALGVAVVVVVAGTMSTLGLIGHSGARAVWGGLLIS
jgi:hypothetical protein